MGAFFQIDLSCDYEAGVDPCMHGNESAYLFLKRRAYPFDNFMYLTGCFDRSHRIVFMGLCCTKQSHDRITDELLDEAFVFRYNLRDFAKYPTHDLFYFLWIKFFRQEGITRKIREKYGHILSFIGCYRNGPC